MKSLQDYIDTYKRIANDLGIKGDSAELLIQLLANASYISEVENIVYSQEASLERATLVNSKIQHCVDSMYSVFRGTCPRVILNLKPLKYQVFNPYDEIISSNSFKVYYLGYFDDNDEIDKTSILGGVKYSTLAVYPTTDEKPIKIVGLLAKETVVKDWSLGEKEYYVECEGVEDLSNDMWVTINKGQDQSINMLEVTRQFSEHILNGKIFDLTLPSFSSRLYVSGTNRENGNEGNWGSNHTLTATYYKYSQLESYNESELKRLSMKGMEPVSFNEKIYNEKSWIDLKGIISGEIANGIILVKESERDLPNSIHYKANKDRYISSVVRSNSDLGSLLVNLYPEKVEDTNVIYKTNAGKSNLIIYYIPKDKYENTLGEDDIEAFKRDRKAYYITDDFEVSEGIDYSVTFNIEVELYQGSTGDINKSIEDILQSYNKKFGINFLESSGNTELIENSVFEEIKILISKLSSVKRILNLSIDYVNSEGRTFKDTNNVDDDWNLMIEDLVAGKAYYNVSQTIKSVM